MCGRACRCENAVGMMCGVVFGRASVRRSSGAYVRCGMCWMARRCSSPAAWCWAPRLHNVQRRGRASPCMGPSPNLIINGYDRMNISPYCRWYCYFRLSSSSSRTPAVNQRKHVWAAPSIAGAFAWVRFAHPDLRSRDGLRQHE
jgi:hypothetical protein